MDPQCCPHCALVRPCQTPLHPPSIHLSTTTDAPLDSEIRATHESIGAGRARISEIDDKMDFLESSLATLRQQRQAVEHHIQQHLFILSPIRRLPFDLLGEIFSWTLPDGLFSSMDMSLSPWVLTRVSSRWRNVSVSLPSLWSNISIRESDRHPSLLLLLSAQLQRSGSYPLAISLEYGHNEALESLVCHSNRWHTISVTMHQRMIPLLNQTAGRLPLLRSVTHRGAQDISHFTAFQTAPHLRHVYTSNSTLPAPYAQLVRLNQPAPQTLPEAAGLRLAHNLIELTLRNTRPLEDIGTVELPRLRRLRVHDGLVLDSLVLPVLEDICITGQLLSLASLIRRSHCSLRKLICLDSSPEISVLQHLPALTELHCEQDDSVDIITPLIVPPHDSSYRLLCPELRTVHFRCHYQGDGSDLTPLMESRQHSTLCPPLSLVFHEFYDVNPHMLEIQFRLRQKGMDIQWARGMSSWNEYTASLLEPFP
ncbi:hypothetical protein C8J57DRAFT_1358328 [Mycena rebaudengoi]|nr:hypothetical protein C8J57DRAFT_1358328 [Mycena rebaudengoi]